MKWHEKKDVQEQRRAWYRRLKADGFADIEQVIDRKGRVGDLLKGMSSGDLRRGLYKVESEDYFRYARQHGWEMPTGVDRAVWHLHAEGINYKEIYRRVKPYHPSLSYRMVRRIVDRERAAMLEGLKPRAREDEEE